MVLRDLKFSVGIYFQSWSGFYDRIPDCDVLLFDQYAFSVSFTLPREPTRGL